VSVQLIPVGFIKPYFPAETVTVEVGEGKTTEQLLQELGVNGDLVAMVLINGRQAAKDELLHDGDVVKLIPFVGGG
jgi:sulfur carrier protein ThiS